MRGVSVRKMLHYELTQHQLKIFTLNSVDYAQPKLSARTILLFVQWFSR